MKRTSGKLRQYLPEIVFLILGMLLLVLTVPEKLSTDTLTYAYSARENHQLFHPHHLIYGPAVRVIWLSLSAVAGNLDTLAAGRIHNGFYLLVLVLLTARLFRLHGLTRLRSVLIASILLFGFGFWNMTLSGEVYVPSLTLCVAIFVWMEGRKELPGAGLILGWGLLLSLAVLYHQLAVLTSLPLLWVTWKKWGLPGLKRGVWMVGTGGALTLMVYILCLQPMNYPLSVQGFFDYVFNYAKLGHEDTGTFANFSLSGLHALLRGHASALFAYPYGAVVLYQILAGLSLVLILVLSFRREKTAFLESMLLWYGSYLLFIFWWLPGEYEFYLTPLWVLFALGVPLIPHGWPIRQTPLRPAHFLFLPLLLMFILNLPHMFMAPHRPWEPKQKAGRIASSFPEETLLLTNYFEAEFLRYYHPHTTLKADQVLRDQFRGEPGFLTELTGRPKALPTQFLDPAFVPVNFPAPPTPDQWETAFVWLSQAIPGDSGTIEAVELKVKQVGDQTFAEFSGPPYPYPDAETWRKEAAQILEPHVPAAASLLRKRAASPVAFH